MYLSFRTTVAANNIRNTFDLNLQIRTNTNSKGKQAVHIWKCAQSFLSATEKMAVPLSLQLRVVASCGEDGRRTGLICRCPLLGTTDGTLANSPTPWSHMASRPPPVASRHAPHLSVARVCAGQGRGAATACHLPIL